MKTLEQLRQGTAPLAERVVACLCAAWCRTCTAYAADFSRLAARFPEHHFIWIDVDPDDDIIGEVDIETFPTVLIGQGDQVLFGGVLLPHIEHLERLLGALGEPSPTTSPATTRDFLTILNRLRAVS